MDNEVRHEIHLEGKIVHQFDKKRKQILITKTEIKRMDENRQETVKRRSDKNRRRKFAHDLG